MKTSYVYQESFKNNVFCSSSRVLRSIVSISKTKYGIKYMPRYVSAFNSTTNKEFFFICHIFIPRGDLIRLSYFYE